jgi:ketosteroid isomerase-like protein
MSSEQNRLLSRRIAVTYLGLGGITAVLAAGNADVVTAQSASPEATSGTIPPLLIEWAAAWTSRVPERLLALYAADAVYQEIPTGSIARGLDEIRAFVEITHAAFSDIQVTPRSGFQAQEWAVLEGDFAARAAEGQPFSVPFAIVIELEGNTIRRSADYFDLNAVLTQIDAAPVPRVATPPGTPTP